MSLRKITLTSLAIAVTALMTVCGSSKSDGGQTTLPLVDNNNITKTLTNKPRPLRLTTSPTMMMNKPTCPSLTTPLKMTY